MAGQEKQFENKVRAYLNSIGAYVYKTMGGLFTKSGIADLLVCYKGYFIAIELKAKDGKPSALQIYNKKLVERAGGISIILYPEYFNKLKEFLKSLKPVEHIIYLDLDGIPVWA